VGAPRSHTTGRTHDLSFRAGTALFGSFGIEWDIASATAEERARLAEWVALYKRLRGLLHTGTVVRTQSPDPALWVHGVVSADGDEAVFAVAAVASSAFAPLGQVRLPGLRPDVRYRVRPLPPGDAPSTVGPPPPWVATGECVLSGEGLGSVGLQMPSLHPEQLFLLHLAAV